MNLMTPDQVATLPASGVVSVDLHTHRHRVPLDPTLFSRETVENRDRIVAMTGISSDHFCYPSGDYHPEFLPWLSEARVKSATTCEVGFASRASHPLLLPRFLDTNTLTSLEFEAWLAGVSQVLPRRRVPAHRVVGEPA